MNAVVGWLRARTENVAVGLLAAMFLSFIVQIFSRYVLNNPVSWTVEVCLTAWIWVVFWGGAFLIDDRRHVRFDVFYLAARPAVRRVFALISAFAIVAGFALSLPATVDYVTFMKIETSATLGIRLDLVFGIYVLFVVAVILRYGWRAVRLGRGDDIGTVDGAQDEPAP
jgi:C4-dicarboxylate transporter, DctQ subunit